jgi:L-erythro-3,5-diaminohexanoate dehydrogenase
MVRMSRSPLGPPHQADTPPAATAAEPPPRQRSGAESPLGLHRVAGPEGRRGVLPQAAWKLDPDPRIWPGEVRVRVGRLNLDAASFRQLSRSAGGDPAAVRAAVLGIVAERGKMQNPVTGSGGMLTGVVEEAGPASPLGLKPGDRIATLVSLTLTPLAITDGLARWDGRSEQVPCDGHAILFARSIAAVLPADLPVPLALAVLDVCGAPALTQRVVTACAGAGHAGAGQRAGAGKTRLAGSPVVAVLGAAGKSGSLSAAAAREAGAARIIGVVPTEHEASLLREASGFARHQEDGRRGGVAAGIRPARQEGPLLPSPLAGEPAPPLVDEIVIADATQPARLAEAVANAGGPADVTVVCVDAPGCEGGAILATRQGGTVIFFSMATSFSAAALGAEGMAADVTMLIGNGYVPGHAQFALGLIRGNPGLRRLFERRVPGDRERETEVSPPALHNADNSKKPLSQPGKAETR